MRAPVFIPSRLLVAFAVLCVVSAIWHAWHSDAMFAARVAMARARGYDGCVCPDCAPVYGLGKVPGCRPCPSAAQIAQLHLIPVAFCYGFSVLLRLPVGQRQVVGCAVCGYGLVGLPTPRCPECGHWNGPDTGMAPLDR